MPAILRTLSFNPSTEKIELGGAVDRVLPKFILNIIQRELNESKATLQDYIDIANLELAGKSE